MLWRLLQAAIFFGVVWSNGVYQWTPNGLVAGIVAFFCAFGATVLLGDLFRFLSWTINKLRAVLSKQSASKRLPRRRG